MASGRLHHAWIFHGPAGVGKFTTAMAFGCALLGVEAGTIQWGDEDDEHDDEAGLRTPHPDLHVVTKELARYSDDATVRNRKLTQIPVEVLREYLIGPVNRAAQAGGRKVFIVDEAELLNPTGQNALLKTLEEPPAGTVIVLVTSSEERLLPTIRSRCQRQAFVPLSDAVVRDWVQQSGKVAAGEVDWLVRFAAGSLGRATLAVEHGLAEWGQTILPRLDQAANGQGGGALGGLMAERIDGFAKGWVEAHKNASKEAANKLAADLMGAMLANHARHRLHELAGGVDGDLSSAEAAASPWLGVIDAVSRMRELLGSNVNLSIVCDHLAASVGRPSASVG